MEFFLNELNELQTELAMNPTNMFMYARLMTSANS